LCQNKTISCTTDENIRSVVKNYCYSRTGDTAETTKAQLREARGAWTELDSLSRSLENDLQGSRSEIDHLRAKLQHCGATIAHLKSDRVLLQEAAMQAETKNNGSADSTFVAREFVAIDVSSAHQCFSAFVGVHESAAVQEDVYRDKDNRKRIGHLH
jgi:hypothetical protein